MFTEYSDKPFILHLDTNLYIALYLYGMDDEIVNINIYWNVILPEVLEIRRRKLEDEYNVVLERGEREEEESTKRIIMNY